jgi:outer membrane receptor for ferric coprogen and ferric-rhodotorulic acid
LGARDNYYRNVSTFNEELELGPPIGTFRFSESPINNVSTGVVTPYAGLTYDINKLYTLYASYADIFQPNAGQITPEGSALPAMRGVNLEVGAKAAWYDGLLNGSFALFKINQRNNPAYVSTPNLGNLQNCCYLPGDNTSKGIDTELTGHLTPSWQIGAGYTFDVNRQNANVANVPGVPGGLLSTITPKHILKVWTNYRLPGVADRWSLGGGVRAQSSSYSIGYACPVSDSMGNCLGASVPYNIRQGFYTVVTLRAAYVINTHWSVALNVDNLFDRAYYQTLGTVVGGNWYGTPRSFMLTLRGQL